MLSHPSKLSRAYHAVAAYFFSRTLLGYFIRRHMTRLRWLLLLMTMMLLGAIYLLSPYPAVHALSKALEDEDLPTLRTAIPASLLRDLIPNTHPDQHWTGAGKTYLKRVWPQFYREIDRHAWLSIEAQSLKAHQTQHYRDDLNHYALDFGSGHDQIRFEFDRSKLINWQLARVCYPSPQPDVVAKRCPSSKR